MLVQTARVHQIGGQLTTSTAAARESPNQRAVATADRFLGLIVLGVVGLVVVALVLVRRQPESGYLEGNSPDVVAHNYLRAVRAGDHERILGALSKSLPGLPASVDQLVLDMVDCPYCFEDRSWGDQLDSSIVVRNSVVTDHTAIVTVDVTRFTSAIFDQREIVRTFKMTLTRTEDEWRIVQSDRYFYPCWAKLSRCPTSRRRPVTPLPVYP